MSHVEQTDASEDEGAEMNEHMRPRGRHHLPRSSRPRTSGLRPFRAIAAATGLVAAVAAITLALTGVRGHAADASYKTATTAAAVQAPTLTPAEAAAWAGTCLSCLRAIQWIGRENRTMRHARNLLMTVAMTITAAAVITTAIPASAASASPGPTSAVSPLISLNPASVDPASAYTVIPFITVPASASPASASALAAVQHAAGQVQTGTMSNGPAAIPTQDLSQRPTLTGNDAVYQNAESDTSFVIRPITNGVQTLIDISGSAAPTQFTFSMPLPPGTRYRVNADGSADIVTAEGLVIGTLAKPWPKAPTAIPYLPTTRSRATRSYRLSRTTARSTQ